MLHHFATLAYYPPVWNPVESAAQAVVHAVQQVPELVRQAIATWSMTPPCAANPNCHP